MQTFVVVAVVAATVVVVVDPLLVKSKHPSACLDNRVARKASH
jgi:predicted regulator of Ras-like GTPase activity (Roadblock/LC7/MglB family)